VITLLLIPNALIITESYHSHLQVALINLHYFYTPQCPQHSYQPQQLLSQSPIVQFSLLHPMQFPHFPYQLLQHSPVPLLLSLALDLLLLMDHHPELKKKVQNICEHIFKIKKKKNICERKLRYILEYEREIVLKLRS